jgi:integrase/recombinase XerD
LWLHGKSTHTQRAYRTEAERFVSFVARPLHTITLMDLQAYADSLGGAPATRIRALAAVKSLLTFGQRTGFLLLNVSAALKLPPRKDTLAERILDEADVHTLLACEPGHRNRVLLRLLCRAGLRVSQIAGLSWRDLHTRDAGRQVTAFGKDALGRGDQEPHGRSGRHDARELRHGHPRSSSALFSSPPTMLRASVQADP